MSGAVWDFAHSRLKDFSDLPLITSEEGALKPREILAASDELATSLVNAGLKERSLVCCALPNSLAFVPAFLSLCRLSASIALTSPKFAADELRMIANGLHPSFVLTTPSFGYVCADAFRVLETVPIRVKVGKTDLVLLKIGDDQKSPVTEDTAIIKFSSGSTGTLKAIPLTFGNLLAETNTIVASLELTSCDQIIAPVPLYHSYGFDLGVMTMLHAGTPLVVSTAFVPRKLLKEMAEKNSTVVLGVPTMYRTLIDTFVTSVPDLTHIRYLLSCTAPLPVQVIEEFHRRFHVPICQHYGSSETGALTTHVPARVLAKPESVGTSMKNVEMAVVDESGRELPPGSEGEIVVSSKAMASGYLMAGRAERSPFRNGKFWTGDIGTIDTDGFFSIHGRADDRINVAGLKVSPQEVVSVLERYSAVREAAVLGVKDSLGEEMVYAVVTVSGTVTEKEMLEHCHHHLAEHKIPRRIEIRDELPRGPSGKIRIRREDIRL
ncbi:MAG TPA: AMP-binding protein [Bacteroidota bacterium]|nr:AMP-binding protein [Bacteroidota bacterium]